MKSEDNLTANTGKQLAVERERTCKAVTYAVSVAMSIARVLAHVLYGALFAFFNEKLAAKLLDSLCPIN